MLPLPEALDNRTIMMATCAVLDGVDGHEYVTAIAKMTWQVDSATTPEVALERSPIRRQPLFEGERADALRWPSDIAPKKPGTDVLLAATAQPPPGAGVTQFEVSLAIAARQGARVKRARIYGPRRWQLEGSSVVPGPAAAAEPVALSYANAFGGHYEADGEIVSLDANPAGSGFASHPEQRIGQWAPLIEHPDAPLSSSSPAAIGFGPIAKHWPPRAARGGTYDSAWREQRFPFGPADAQWRHNCTAPDDQWFDTPLIGDERIVVEGVRPDSSALAIELPRYRPRFDCHVAGEQAALDTHLDTVLIDADRGRVELVWRASFRAPRKVERVEWVRVLPADRLPEPVATRLNASLRAAQAPTSELRS